MVWIELKPKIRRIAETAANDAAILCDSLNAPIQAIVHYLTHGCPKQSNGELQPALCREQ